MATPITADVFRAARPLIAIAALLIGAVIAPGCSSPGASLKVDSTRHAITMAPVATTAIYTSPDSNTADIYLSDLPLETLTGPGADLSRAVGSIIHIHLFLYPRAGRVPLDKSACDATVRHIILAGTDGGVGCYGGGGFILPSGPPGKAEFSGSIREMTVKLLRSGPAFKDRLGIAKVTGSFTTVRDEAAARALAQRVDSLIANLPTVETPDEASSKKAASR